MELEKVGFLDAAAREFGKNTEIAGLLAEAEVQRKDIDTAWKRTGVQNFVLDPHTVRYVRVTPQNNSAHTGRHLVEVMVYDE